jgi:peptidyl-prolyl cis-trans isomerase D
MPRHFREPERTSIRYLLFTPEQFAGEVQPSDDELKAYYDEHVADYTTQERVKAQYILVPDGAGGDRTPTAWPSARERTRCSPRSRAEPISRVGEEGTEDTNSAPKGGDLGYLSRGQMVPDFENAVFAMEPGTVSEVIESPFGLHTSSRSTRSFPGGTESPDEARPKIRPPCRHSAVARPRSPSRKKRTSGSSAAKRCRPSAARWEESEEAPASPARSRSAGSARARN